MKRFLPILILLCLLCGCAAIPAEPSATAAPTVTAATTSPVETTMPPATTEPVTEPSVKTTAATEPPVIDPLEVMLEQMTTQELVGQLFLARCPDIHAVEDIGTYHLGGYILFGRDFRDQTADSLRQTIAAYQAASAVPMLIAVDEEGGTVTRVSGREAFRAEKFPAPADAYAQGGMDMVLDAEIEKCKLLRHLGINVNMAPVCDVTTDPDAFMYSRSLRLEPEEAGGVIGQIVTAMGDTRVGSVLKHFPGYGNNADTHSGIAEDYRSLNELENRDLIPFRAGIDAGCDAVLVSHTVVYALDSDHPASLSPAVIRYLRQEMGFDGVIITDDLVMDAITDAYGTEESAVLAVLAGCDLLCSSEYVVQYRAVLDAVTDGRIPLEQVKASVLRILRWKQNLGLLP